MLPIFRTGSLLLAMLFSSTHASGDIVIDFDDLALNGSDEIPQTYGDNALFNVSYRELESFGNSTVVGSSLAFWTVGYGDLENVVWGSDNIPSRVAEIRIESLSTNPLLLNTFDVADWNGTANNQTLRVYDGSYGQLFELASLDITDITRNTIAPNVSSNVLVLQWDHPWAVAVDNISITAVPEPGSFAMLAVCPIYCVFRRSRITSRCTQAADRPLPA